MDIEHIKTIIIGAGPAGTTCGYKLVKDNEECLIIDRKEFPRDKLCGGGLTPKTHALVDNIFEGIQYDYSSFHELNIYLSGKFIRRFVLDSELRVVLRKEFDNILLTEYKKIGGNFITDTLIGIQEKGDKIFLQLQSGKTLSCHYLIGADGANSTVRKYLQPGFSRGIVCLEQYADDLSVKDVNIYYDKKFKAGFLYVFPNKKGYAVGYGSKKKDSVEDFKDALEALKLGNDSKIKGAYIPMFDKIDYPFRDNILLIGDAGGYTDSFTGEGIYYAVKSGENATIAIAKRCNFKELNKPIIDKILRRTKISNIFAYYPVLWFSMQLCKNSLISGWINKKANRIL